MIKIVILFGIIIASGLFIASVLQQYDIDPLDWFINTIKEVVP